MNTHQAGCEVKITEQAAKEFKSMCEDENKLLENSYLRVEQIRGVVLDGNIV